MVLDSEFKNNNIAEIKYAMKIEKYPIRYQELPALTFTDNKHFDVGMYSFRIDDVLFNDAKLFKHSINEDGSFDYIINSYYLTIL